jgi:hypothetical protein
MLAAELDNYFFNSDNFRLYLHTDCGKVKHPNSDVKLVLLDFNALKQLLNSVIKKK